jgi:hypothetical protein
MIGGVLCFPAAAAGSSTDWAVAVPVIVAIVGAALAYGGNWYLKRRDEKRELQALVRLLDHELATLQYALKALMTAAEQSEVEALVAAAEQSDQPGPLVAAARVVAEARSGTVWSDRQLALARGLRFEEWDLLCDVYATLDVAWLGAPSDVDDLAGSELAALTEAVFNAESVAPRLLKVIGMARDVCLPYLGGRPPAKVSLGSTDDPSE